MNFPMKHGLAVLSISSLFLISGCTKCSKDQAPALQKELQDDHEVSAGGKTVENGIDWSSDAEGLSKVVAVVGTNKGTFKFKFYPEKAPKTVRRIAELMQQNFYNGLIFHRVVPGFVVQGGDPSGTGAGGSGQHIEAEFNDIPHVKGTVAMARAQDPNSADSQFYISLGRHPHLDKNYTVFGYVIEGIEAVEKIEKGDKMTQVLLEFPVSDSTDSGQ